ncbi:lipid-binding SYLF domain-containing protein [Shewanella surugensis]|uniref:Lipid-binding SYLF domain-containing protein n=1 Tax=Shewanella surugensis TaxID=212020 RepID=A0ABT0LGR6_9GAMM|nr:lipid-binding SYLF domain-containing protein [Shewanella surugensis]MCL1126744.1 lipid-binding SYLF domain-containing protein [Shewanella surugensis]
MKHLMSKTTYLLCIMLGLFFTTQALADNNGGSPDCNKIDDSYQQAICNFSKAKDTRKFFSNAYGYALFPTIGKGGFIVGGAYGDGHVYKSGRITGDTSLTQLSVGFQLGGQAYSEIIFFENEDAYKKFTSGNFEFSAQASAVAITIGANAQTSTTGNSASAGKSAATASYVQGMATFTLAKGGLMYEAALAGQKFTFDKRD